MFLVGWKAVIPMSSLWSVDAALSSDTVAENYSGIKASSWSSTESFRSKNVHNF